MTFQTAALTAFAAAGASGLAGGTLQLMNSGGTSLATVTLNSPASTNSGAVQTFSGFPKSTTGTAGTVANARFRTSGGTDWRTGIPVGIPGSGAQVIVDNGIGTLVIAAGQTVTVTAASITHTAA